MHDTRTRIDKLFEQIPEAIWSPGKPVPYVYRGTPIEMVEQMAHEMGPDVSVSEAMDTLLHALATTGRMKLRIVGDPPENIRAGIFVFSLLQQGIFAPMASA